MRTRFPKYCIAVSILLCTLGCEPTAVYRFRIIDEATGRPLEGVPVETYLEGHHFNNRMFWAEGHCTTFTDGAGIAPLELKTANGLFYVLFIEQPGYQAISGDLYTFEGHYRLAHHKKDTLPSDVDEETKELPLKADAVIEIPMRRVIAEKPKNHGTAPAQPR